MSFSSQTVTSLNILLRGQIEKRSFFAEHPHFRGRSDHPWKVANFCGYSRVFVETALNLWKTQLYSWKSRKIMGNRDFIGKWELQGEITQFSRKCRSFEKRRLKPNQVQCRGYRSQVCFVVRIIMEPSIVPFQSGRSGKSIF